MARKGKAYKHKLGLKSGGRGFTEVGRGIANKTTRSHAVGFRRPKKSHKMGYSVR